MFVGAESLGFLLEASEKNVTVVETNFQMKKIKKIKYTILKLFKGYDEYEEFGVNIRNNWSKIEVLVLHNKGKIRY